MAKPHKIKRYRRVYKSRSNPGSIVLIALGFVLLLFVGLSIYRPVMNFLTSQNDPNRPVPELQLDPLPEASQEAEEPSEGTPAEDTVPEVNALPLRTAYMPAAVLSDDAARNTWLDGLDADVNTVLIDIKDKQGAVLFKTANESAVKWGTVSGAAVDLMEFAEDLAGRDLHLAVRMSAFSDQLAPYGDREIAIRYQNSEWLWLDGNANAGGKPWLNPYAEGARQYITDLAVEAVESGAVLVILEDVQFAFGSTSVNAYLGETGNKTRQQILREFVGTITGAVESAGGQLGVYLPASVLNDNSTTQILYGGNPLEILDNTLVAGLLPYQFTNGYVQDGLELPTPLGNTPATMSAVLDYVQGLLENRDIKVIPLIQGGSETQNAIGGAQVAEQLSLVRAAGLESYILYQSAGAYLYS